MNKLLVASEYTEPSFHRERIIERLNALGPLHKYGLLLITKDIEGCLPIWERAKELNIPTVTHITITGLGDSKLEPKAPDWKISMTVLAALTYLVEDLKTVVLRVDPLIPGVTNFKTIRQIVKEASSFGITRCRTSVIDYYPFVREKFKERSIPTPQHNFQPPTGVKIKLLSQLFTICEEYNMTLESCAEHEDVPGLIKVGCADQKEWEKLGLNLKPGAPRRQECFCNVTKYDLLAYEPTCSYNCLYCYWGKYR